MDKNPYQSPKSAEKPRTGGRNPWLGLLARLTLALASVVVALLVMELVMRFFWADVTWTRIRTTGH